MYETPRYVPTTQLRKSLNSFPHTVPQISQIADSIPESTLSPVLPRPLGGSPPLRLLALVYA